MNIKEFLIKIRGNKKVLIIVLIVFTVILISSASLIIFNRINLKNKYDIAMQCFNNKNYAAAADKFLDLEDYKDSKSMYKKSELCLTDVYIANGKYTQALDILRKIGNCDDQTKYCINSAAKFYAKNDIPGLYYFLSNLYESEKELLINSQMLWYVCGCHYFNEKNFAIAQTAFENASNYQKAEEYSNLSAYCEGVQLCNEGKLCSAAEKFKPLAERKFLNSVKLAIEIRKTLICGGWKRSNNGTEDVLLAIEGNDGVINMIYAPTDSSGKKLTASQSRGYRIITAYDGYVMVDAQTAKTTTGIYISGDSNHYTLTFSDGIFSGNSFESAGTTGNKSYTINYDFPSISEGDISQTVSDYSQTLPPVKSANSVESSKTTNKKNNNSKSRNNTSTAPDDLKSNSGRTNTSAGNNSSDTRYQEPDNEQIDEITKHHHSYRPATCTEPEKCSCGAEQGTALGHSFRRGWCDRCGQHNPDLPTQSSFKVEKCASAVYNGCTISLGSYSIKNLDDYFEGGSEIKIDAEVTQSGNTALIIVEFYDKNNRLLSRQTPQWYSGFGLSVGYKSDFTVTIPSGTEIIKIRSAQ